jgi:hypothetical protein
MKRFLATCTLILCLSFPVLAGHTQVDGRYCSCNNPEHEMMGLRINDEVEKDTHQDSAPEIDLGLLLVAVLLVLKFRA